jgi:AP-2 complex subunit alpha
MPKFPERESALLKKAEDAEVDTAEQSAIKLRSQQQTSSALVVADHPSANGSTPAANHLTLVKMPSQTVSDIQESSATYEEAPNPPVEAPKENGPVEVESNATNVTDINNEIKVEPPSTSRSTSPADLLADLLGPLAIEAPPAVEQHPAQGLDANQSPVGDLALATLEDQSNSVQPIVNVEEKFHILCTKDSGVLYEDPHIQVGLKAEWRAHHGRLVLFLGNKNTSPLMSVRALILPPSHLKMELSSVPDTIPPRAQVQVPLEIANLRASRDVAVLDFSYTFGTALVDAKLRLPVVLNKFLQPITLTPDEFFPQWKALTVHSLKVQEVVKGVKPMPLPEMANLFMSLHLAVAPGLDNNPNNLVACTTFFSEATRAMLCLIRVETDPQDRTQLRLTVASGDQYLTFEYKLAPSSRK